MMDKWTNYLAKALEENRDLNIWTNMVTDDVVLLDPDIGAVIINITGYSSHLLSVSLINNNNDRLNAIYQQIVMLLTQNAFIRLEQHYNYTDSQIQQGLQSLSDFLARAQANVNN